MKPQNCTLLGPISPSAISKGDFWSTLCTMPFICEQEQSWSAMLLTALTADEGAMAVWLQVLSPGWSSTWAKSHSVRARVLTLNICAIFCSPTCIFLDVTAFESVMGSDNYCCQIMKTSVIFLVFFVTLRYVKVNYSLSVEGLRFIHQSSDLFPNSSAIDTFRVWAKPL